MKSLIESSIVYLNRISIYQSSFIYFTIPFIALCLIHSFYLKKDTKNFLAKLFIPGIRIALVLCYFFFLVSFCYGSGYYESFFYNLYLLMLPLEIFGLCYYTFCLLYSNNNILNRYDAKREDSILSSSISILLLLLEVFLDHYYGLPNLLVGVLNCFLRIYSAFILYNQPSIRVAN